MKDPGFVPEFNADRYRTLIYPFLETQIVHTAVELGLFSTLDEGRTSDELAAEADLHPGNTALLLDALVACNYLTKLDGVYRNLPETSYFLSSDSEMYLGDSILYWREMTDLSGLTRLVEHGPGRIGFSDAQGSDYFDFRAMGQGAKNMLYTGGVQQFIATMRDLLNDERPFRVLDMGCGSGIMSIELARNFPNAHVTLFDQPAVVAMTQANVDEYGVGSQTEVIAGNFVTDDLGGPYDLIIASAVMNFGGDLPAMATKLRDALADDGRLYMTGNRFSDDRTSPQWLVLGWLSSGLHGLDILKTGSEIATAFEDAGFTEVNADPSSPQTILAKAQA